MKIPEPIRASGPWKLFDEFVNIVFWIDLFVNFFFTYNTVPALVMDGMSAVL